jgi:hypothetical protein
MRPSGSQPWHAGQFPTNGGFHGHPNIPFGILQSNSHRYETTTTTTTKSTTTVFLGTIYIHIIYTYYIYIYMITIIDVNSAVVQSLLLVTV